MNDSPLAHPEWLALVAAMRFAPDDDTPRVIGADWLTETGKPELIAWGEFIRYQCDGAREPIRDHVFSESCDCRRCKCERKATVLADRWRMLWDYHTWASGGITVDAPTKMWQRGFLTTGIMPLVGPNLRHMPRVVPSLFERQPIAGMMLRLTHNHPTRGPDLLTCSVSVEPSQMARTLVVKAILIRRDRPAVSVQGVRWARQPNQFGTSISAAIGEAIKKRSALLV